MAKEATLQLFNFFNFSTLTSNGVISNSDVGVTKAQQASSRKRLRQLGEYWSLGGKIFWQRGIHNQPDSRIKK